MSTETQPRETRRRPEVEVRCGCGKKVILYAETHEWDNRGRHCGYGPASGECECGLVHVDVFGVIKSFRP